MGSLAKQLSGQCQQTKAYAKGGSVHTDETMDKKLIKKVVKPSALKPSRGKMKK
jgi:hypothetical protein